MKRGAYDFVTKPFATSELRALARKALERRTLTTENERLRARIERDRPSGILGHSAAIKRVLDLAQRSRERQDDRPDHRRERHRAKRASRGPSTS